MTLQNSKGNGNKTSISSRQMGTWPQLMGCALFKILSLDGLTEIWKLAEGIQNTWEGELGRFRWMSETENR